MLSSAAAEDDDAPDHGEEECPSDRIIELKRLGASHPCPAQFSSELVEFLPISWLHQLGDKLKATLTSFEGPTGAVKFVLEVLFYLDSIHLFI